MPKTKSILSKLLSFSVFEFLSHKKRTLLGNHGSKNLPKMDFLVVFVLIVCFIMVLFLVFLFFFFKETNRSALQLYQDSKDLCVVDIASNQLD